MPDVFISYSKGDKELAAELAAFLEEAGLSVWWDEALVGGAPFRERIHEVIDQSQAGLVIWSRRSAKSDFVIDEADLCRQQGKLVSLLSDGFEPRTVPLGFRNAHHIGLPDGTKLLEALREKGVNPQRPITQYVLRLFRDRVSQKSAARRSGPYLLGGALALGLLTAAAAWPLVASRDIGKPTLEEQIDINLVGITENDRPLAWILFSQGRSVAPSTRVIVKSIEVAFLADTLEVVDTEKQDREFAFSSHGYQLKVPIDSRRARAVASRGYVLTCWEIAFEGGASRRIGRLFRVKDVAIDAKRASISFDVEPPELKAADVAGSRRNCKLLA